MIYLVLVDRFANGDPSNDGAVDPADPAAFHGGDLAGITQHLDWIAGLGVERLWLTPLSRMRTTPFYGHGAFHGYWVEELGALEPRFGTAAELDALRAGLAARGMGLVLDMVYNHVAPEGELLAAKPGWFHEGGPIRDWNDPVQVVEGRVHGLPDLAQENEEVYAHLVDASRWWVQRAAPAMLRIDAVRHMPTSFLARLHADLPGIPFLGEVFDGNPWVVGRAAREAGLDAVFDFPLYYAMVDVFCRDAHPGALGAVLAQDVAYPPGTELVTFLDNHDLPRIRTACGSAGRVQDALRFQFAARGTPSITWGTEAELEGAGEPENRASMRFIETPTGALLRGLAATRQEDPALRTGDTRDVSLDGSVYAFVRTGPAPRLVVVNRGETPRVIRGVEAAPRAVTVAPWQGRLPPAGKARVRLEGPAGCRMVGSAPELGAWDPEHGAPLPATLRLPRRVVAAKVVCPRAGGGWDWQEGPNRYFLPG